MSFYSLLQSYWSEKYSLKLSLRHTTHSLLRLMSHTILYCPGVSFLFRNPKQIASACYSRKDAHFSEPFEFENGRKEFTPLKAQTFYLVLHFFFLLFYFFPLLFLSLFLVLIFFSTSFILITVFSWCWRDALSVKIIFLSSSKL